MRDAAFCYPCRLFGRASPGRSADTFTEKGFRDWKHATGQSGMLSKHDSSHISVNTPKIPKRVLQ